MALIYAARLAPTKLEMIGAWMPARPWSGGATPSAVLGAYRFDDPSGEVGVETILVRVADRALQVPLTYRAEPLPGGGAGLLTVADHSVLGRRWVYDGGVDPVHTALLARAIVTGGAEAAEWVVPADHQGGSEGGTFRAATVRVGGRGAPGSRVPDVPGPDAPAVTPVDDPLETTLRVGPLTVVLRRVLGAPAGPGALATLDGTWPGRAVPGVLAALRR